MDRLNIPVPPSQPGPAAASPQDPSLDTYKLLLEAEGETVGTTKEKGPPSQLNDSSENPDDKLSDFILWRQWLGASAAWAEESLSSSPSPEDEIRQVLEQYRQAYQQKDLERLSYVYDTMTSAQREANAKYFLNVRDLQVRLSEIDIAVRGNEAAVSYTREDQFIDSQTGKKVTLEVRFTKLLTRVAGGWKIASGKKP
jgi:ketosteroid isomerase-like protein